MQTKKLQGDKLILARVPYDLWKDMRTLSLEEEISINTTVKNLLISYIKKRRKEMKKSLTNSDNMIT